MPRSNRSRRRRRDRRPDYQIHHEQRQDNVRATEDLEENFGVPNHHVRFSAESELREYTTARGPILELADLHPIPNVPENRFCSMRPGYGVWGVSDEEMDILHHFRQMRMSRPGRDIIYQFTYRDDEAVARAKQAGCPVRITSSLGRRPVEDMDRGLARNMVEHGASPPEGHAIRMGRPSQPVVDDPASRPPQASLSSQQDELPPQTPLRQIKKEEPE
ncbi:hypothetical protein FPANT_2447 [Fusarium pseudoanthophilum]|uniref:Uncharacterized protein n=1 Tax=Fusarium pseudoanthophilum TaxID=48495 RepID=A0A8H5PP80_9HYPO|nr:hypothetical protein FPANT_2447 [Fusarium pseudoanthophilum]